MHIADARLCSTGFWAGAVAERGGGCANAAWAADTNCEEGTGDGSWSWRRVGVELVLELEPGSLVAGDGSWNWEELELEP
eukprot:10145154-Karenia_brevis.AAC.2